MKGGSVLRINYNRLLKLEITLLLYFLDSLMSFMSESSKSNTNKAYLHVE